MVLPCFSFKDPKYCDTSLKRMPWYGGVHGRRVEGMDFFFFNDHPQHTTGITIGDLPFRPSVKRGLMTYRRVLLSSPLVCTQIRGTTATDAHFSVVDDESDLVVPQLIYVDKYDEVDEMARRVAQETIDDTLEETRIPFRGFAIMGPGRYALVLVGNHSFLDGTAMGTLMSKFFCYFVTPRFLWNWLDRRNTYQLPTLLELVAQQQQAQALQQQQQDQKKNKKSNKKSNKKTSKQQETAALLLRQQQQQQQPQQQQQQQQQQQHSPSRPLDATSLAEPVWVNRWFPDYDVHGQMTVFQGELVRFDKDKMDRLRLALRQEGLSITPAFSALAAKISLKLARKYATVQGPDQIVAIGTPMNARFLDNRRHQRRLLRIPGIANYVFCVHTDITQGDVEQQSLSTIARTIKQDVHRVKTDAQYRYDRLLYSIHVVRSQVRVGCTSLNIPVLGYVPKNFKMECDTRWGLPKVWLVVTTYGKHSCVRLEANVPLPHWSSEDVKRVLEDEILDTVPGTPLEIAFEDLLHDRPMRHVPPPAPPTPEESSSPPTPSSSTPLPLSSSPLSPPLATTTTLPAVVPPPTATTSVTSTITTATTNLIPMPPPEQSPLPAITNITPVPPPPEQTLSPLQCREQRPNDSNLRRRSVRRGV